MNLHVPFVQLQHSSTHGCSFHLCSYALSSISLQFIFKQIPQTIILVSFSLVDLTWTHSFKYSSYAEDSQIYYLHSSIWLKAWICLDSNHGWSIPLWPQTSYLISVCLRYPVCEIRDHTIFYYLLVLLWGLNELTYVKCLEYCLHIYNCWLYYCNSRPDFLPELQAYISSRLLGILTSMSNRHHKWIIPKPNLWSLPKPHTTLPLVFFISAKSISIFPFA